MSLNDPEHWEAMYAEKRDGWELGQPTPPLVRAVTWVPPGARAIAIGCGRGHEVRMLATTGWQHVVGVDFAASAIAEATRLTPPELARAIEWRQADLFTLAEHASYDLVLEHT